MTDLVVRSQRVVTAHGIAPAAIWISGGTIERVALYTLAP